MLRYLKRYWYFVLLGASVHGRRGADGPGAAAAHEHDCG